MSATVLLVKNMVCRRCVLVVEDILRSRSIDYKKIIIGRIDLMEALSPDQRNELIPAFDNVGFELIDSRGSALIETIKQLVLKRARNESNESEHRFKLSNYIAATVNHEYTYLSSLFSSVEGRTIENYFIEQRIEKAKELLVYGQLTLSQIAFDLEYSSVAHLSKQFKKITGLTPTYFKEIGITKRTSLDNI
jgi:AraC family transcriptional regulator